MNKTIAQENASSNPSDGPHPSEYVKLLRYGAGAAAAEPEIGELDTLESRFAYGQIWPREVSGRILLNGEPELNFAIWLSTGHVAVEDNDGVGVSDHWEISPEELERLCKLVGWRDSSDEWIKARIAEGMDYGADPNWGRS